jgi:hypothetical protein
MLLGPGSSIFRRTLAKKIYIRRRRRRTGRKPSIGVMTTSGGSKEVGWAPAPLMTGFTTKNNIVKTSNHH